MSIQSAAPQQPDLDEYNIVWTEQSKNSSESMPVGGGDIGCNVWVENGELLLYVQRSGSIAETNEYLKLGRMRLKFSPNPFSEEADLFQQQLKLKDGYIEIKGEVTSGSNPIKAKIKVWVDVNSPVVHIDVDANKKIKINTSYENWRMKDQVIPNTMRRHSTFNLHAYPGEVLLKKDVVEKEDKGIVFYHRNPDDKILPQLLIEQQGLQKHKDSIVDDLKGRTFGGKIYNSGFTSIYTTKGTYQNVDFNAWHLISKPKKAHRLKLVTHIAQTKTIKDWKKGLEQTIDQEETKDLKNTFKSNKAWWHNFWNRSHILINPDIDNKKDSGWVTARNYQLFRYQMGCNVSGEYPTRFNGGNFTFDAGLVKSNLNSRNSNVNYGPDYRAWGGGVFTAQNQRLLHWPMLKTGDFDAILPHFELFRKALPGAKARVKEHFGHDGAVYSEYTNVPGLALGAGYGWEEGDRKRGTEVPFGDPKVDGNKDYNQIVEKGVMANPVISYHWESQLENAYMIMEYHRYTGKDITKYLPFIKQSVIFFDKHYRAREKLRSGKELDANGQLVIFPSTSCESYRGAKNPVDIVSGLQACLTSLLKLEADYVTPSEKEYFKSFLESLPNYYYDKVEGDTILKPAESWLSYKNIECPQFYPLFPFNRFDVEKDDMTTFKNTWKHGKFPKNIVISWHQDGIFFARMGMMEEAVDYNTKKLANSKRKYPTFWGPGHDWVPDHNWGGSGMIGLQEMLMQCFDDRILLFPAWPKHWNVDFKLHAPKNTIVEGVLKDGQITKLKVTPESRAKDIQIVNKEFQNKH
ncbi:hypothetical protein C1H87_18985 [Flavivirga eckloniae]|uniref:DUF5703 domain-containing protein n=2 Tax=Flavivirga eckloniae TaxID=1803846 RepID=A0A2K9PUF8_9FLAO|nr:hypothetical protein C1H87_18985 [Flavivirga eckloniae]